MEFSSTTRTFLGQNKFLYANDPSEKRKEKKNRFCLISRFFSVHFFFVSWDYLGVLLNVAFCKDLYVRVELIENRRSFGIYYGRLLCVVSSSSDLSQMRETMEQGAGFLKVIIVEGNDLAIRDFKSSDPYVVAKLGKQASQACSSLSF